MAFLGLMAVREHEAVVADLKAENFRLAAGACINPGQHGLVGDECGNSVCTAYASLTASEEARSDSLATIDQLRAELATLKAERDSLLEDKAAMAHDINDLRKALAHWKKHGQLRDPATGRLIPKAKPSDVFTASHSPA